MTGRPHYMTLPKGAVIFTYFDPDTKEQTVIWMSGLKDSLQYRLLPVEHIEIDQAFAAEWLPKRGLERPRIDALAKVPTVRFGPVSMLQWPDGSHLLADGSHRYFVAACRGAHGIRAKLVPCSLWEPFIVTGFPEATEADLKNTFSGIRTKGRK